MALFINSGDHPNVYKNNTQLKEPNQGYLRIDYFSEMVKEQKKLNKTMVTSFQDLQRAYEQQRNIQISQWKEVGNRLKELQQSDMQHEEFETKTKHWIAELNQNSEQLHAMLESESALNREVIKQINELSQSHNEVLNQISQYDLSNQELYNQMSQLMDLQKDMLNRVHVQDEKQNQMLGKLDNQEALMEKTHRQVTHLRSILYERASFLAEKMEESYNVMASFFYNLLTGSDPSLNLFVMKKKDVEDKKSHNG
ncbi:hypothetical protein [Salirhabdus sp. Marseille-P4669]|uniref:hypothetical protein n=1 Tax=Salirhabdus sp. Marseille-P4669 TaxID=2042310 RepID=UPI000C7DBBF7|nr:hypothetical protein [Salirhabdus sp. Marseille-P4669]